MITIKVETCVLKSRYIKFCIKRGLGTHSYNQAISEAQKLVGYPTSFLSLRCLLNDEVADIASHIRKLMGTGHPLINTAKNLIMKKDELPSWGLLVLLLSKCRKPICEQLSTSDDILPQQRTLAEVTEMVRTSNILHNSILNFDKTHFRDEVCYGNKLALLSGDYLLSTSFKLLADMRNQEVNELISTALRDLNESNFIEPRNKQNKAVPAKPYEDNCDIDVPIQYSSDPYNIGMYLGQAKSEWILRSLLNGATLLAKSCEASMLLSGNLEDRKQAHIFGRNLGLTYQASLELKIFNQSDSEFELTSAPILFHLRYAHGFYDEIISNLDNIDYKKIKIAVKSGPGLQKTLELKEEFTCKALEALDKFSGSTAKDVLKNIIKTM